MTPSGSDRVEEEASYERLTVDDFDIDQRTGKTKTAMPESARRDCRELGAPRQGEGWVCLDWKKPAEGGIVSAYKVMRRQRPDGPWAEVATAVISEATLVEQPKGSELEYRIIAINKAGEGEASNTVMVMLSLQFLHAPRH